MLRNIIAPSRKAGGFSLGAVMAVLNTDIRTTLRLGGYITEGYNPERDTFERVFKIGGFSYCHDLRTFTKPDREFKIYDSVYKPGKVPKSLAMQICVNPSHKARQPKKLRAQRGNVSLTFDSMADLRSRLHVLAERSEKSIAPNAPFIITDVSKGEFSFLPASLVHNALLMRKGAGGGRRWTDPLDLHKPKERRPRKAVATPPEGSIAPVMQVAA